MSMGAVLVLTREFDELDGCTTECNMGAFVGWLIDVGETEGLSARELCALHHEFCLIHNLRPLSPAKQASAWGKVGLRKRRPRRNARAKPGGRPMVYHVDPRLVASWRAKQTVRLAA